MWNFCKTSKLSWNVWSLNRYWLNKTVLKLLKFINFSKIYGQKQLQTYKLQTSSRYTQMNHKSWKSKSWTRKKKNLNRINYLLIKTKIFRKIKITLNKKFKMNSNLKKVNIPSKSHIWKEKMFLTYKWWNITKTYKKRANNTFQLRTKKY